MPKLRTDDGIDLNYQLDDFRDPWITDPGDTIVMSHGFARSMSWWAQWVPALSRKYRVLRYDVRGCGESSVPPEGDTWSAEQLAKDALDLMDHLGIEKAHWIGFESGGVWGMVFASTYTDRIKSLTVCNTPLRIGQSGGIYGTVAKTIEKVGLKQWLIDTLPGRMDLSLADPKMLEWHLAEHGETPTHVALSIVGIIENLDLSESLPKIQVPTLILVGDRSRGAPLDEQSSMQKKIPNARLVVFPNISAGIHLLIPDRCVEEVLRFLE